MPTIFYIITSQFEASSFKVMVASRHCSSTLTDNKLGDKARLPHGPIGTTFLRESTSIAFTYGVYTLLRSTRVL